MLNTGLWLLTLSHGVSRTTCGSTQQIQRSGGGADLRGVRTPMTRLQRGHCGVEYKYLGVFIDHKLDWAKNTDAIYKKGHSRLYVPRRLRSFNICRTRLRRFYESVVASALPFAVVCWGSRLRVADANKLNKLIRKASDAVGVELDTLIAVSDRRMLSKLHAILNNVSHPLHDVLVKHRSMFSARLRPQKYTTERPPGSHSCLWPTSYTIPPLTQSVRHSESTNWTYYNASNIYFTHVHACTKYLMYRAHILYIFNILFYIFFKSL